MVSDPNPSRRAFTTDSAAHLLAASPVLMVIARWTGKVGFTLITSKILSGKKRQAQRNAVIVVVLVFLVFLLIIACMVWLARLK